MKLLSSLCLASFFFSSLVETRESNSSNLNYMQEWINATKNAQNLVKILMKEITRPLLKATAEIKLTSICKKHLISIAIGLSRGQFWAIHFLNGNGITSLQKPNYGSYEHCIGVSVPDPPTKKHSSKVLFHGQYCLVEVSPPLPSKPRFYTVNKPLSELETFSSANTTVVRMISAHAQVYYVSPYRIGLCIPSTCNEEDLANLLKSVTNFLALNVQVRRCETKNKLIVNTEQIVVCCIIGFLLLLLAAGTTLDVCGFYFPEINERINEGKFFWKIVLGFSIYNSLRRLLVTDTTQCLRPLYGVRFLTVLWLFAGWVYEEICFKHFHGELRTLDFRKNVFLVPIVNYTVAIDTLFFTSGLLTSYTILQKIDQDKNSLCPFFLFVFSRLRRITPSLILIIGITLCLPWISSGPIWHNTIDPVVEGCRRNWWTNLLYINNLVGTDKPCLRNSWFFATDFQLCLVALLVIFIISRYPKIGLICNLILCLSSVVVTGFITWHKKLPPTMLYIHPDPEDRKKFFSSLYYLPYSHVGALCVGITEGYILFTYPKLVIKRWMQFLGWTFTTIISFLVICGVYNWNQNYEFGTMTALIYASTHRVAWSLCIAWLLLVCCKGYADIINEFLSWEAFEPLNRLGFLSYLLYNLALSSLFGSLKEELIYQNYYIISFIISSTIMAYGISFIIGIVWESPLMTILQHQKMSKANIFNTTDSNFKQKLNENGIYVMKKNDEGYNTNLS